MTMHFPGNPNALDTLLEQDYAHTLAAFYRAATQTNLPVALWQYPNSQQQQALVDFSDAVQATRIDFTSQSPGFAFSPFVNKGGKETLFIKAGLHLSRTGHRFRASRPNNSNGNQKAGYKQIQFLTAYQALAQSEQEAGNRWPVTPPQDRADTLDAKAGASGCAQDRFCALVADAIAYIQSTGIKKVVVSRATETALPANFNPISTFQALCRRYPHAFISLVSIPRVGTWIGASPELLLSLNNERLRTVALAGTQAFRANIPLAGVTWGAKEIEEQTLVSDYIRAFFQQLNLSHFAEEGPRTVSAGNIVHLQSDFRVELEPSQLLELANQVLHSLHPTSAVCGMPKKEALSFILEKEGYNRAFYSGFLGPVHLNGQSNLFVNLRCMQLKAPSAILYVGGGITQDSTPRSEWEETVLKSKTLLSVLKPSAIHYATP